MLAILISVLFGATALAALSIVYDAVRKGRQAWIAIGRELAQADRALPRHRPRVTAVRSSRRTVRATSLPLCAAA